ncbi:MAG TPA: response regulator [Verrucomicrobiae bacterium]|nr:response regulator [Verrucomicrobiae bacterium]
MKKPAKNNSRSLAANSVSATPTVLHIDDDPNDSELFQAAARRARACFSIHNVCDGDQAVAYLSGLGIYSNRSLYPVPALVLLDLKMPRATGFDVLKWIRQQPESARLPVVVLSGSELKDDIQQAYAVGADSYLVKPLGFNALVDLVKTIERLWVSRAGGHSMPRTAAQSRRGWDAARPWLASPDGPAARASSSW